MAFSFEQAKITKREWALLLANSEESKLANFSDQLFDPKPVIKLFDCGGAATWLITESDEDGIAFGLCDLGFGFPELGSVSLPVIVKELGWRLDKDQYFKAEHKLAQYASIARSNQRIIA